MNPHYLIPHCPSIKNWNELTSTMLADRLALLRKAKPELFAKFMASLGKFLSDGRYE